MQDVSAMDKHIHQTHVYIDKAMEKQHNGMQKLGMHRSDTQDRYRLRSGHFLRIGYRRDKTDPNPILCVYYSVLLLSPTKAQKHYKAP